MDMNLTILSQSESWPNMTCSGSLGITDGIQVVQSGGIPATHVVVSVGVSNAPHQSAARPRRRSAESALREASDPEYRRRKQAARAELAADMGFDIEPTSLADVRMSHGMSQSDLAEKTGMTQPHIAKIEARKLAIQLVTARKMATALSISIEQLAALVLPLEADTRTVQAVSDEPAVLMPSETK
ncbi:helix-turn-helix transcriptional regulator [Paraburkholderia strydomiana]|uniref:helix-turn-helix domain-containing protein n=1 Tax=Paraburkholderia strydomiana TaxID=1245417 RepID=UPI0038B94B90